MCGDVEIYGVCGRNLLLEFNSLKSQLEGLAFASNLSCNRKLIHLENQEDFGLSILDSCADNYMYGNPDSIR